jgi:hypothetical protein
LDGQRVDQPASRSNAHAFGRLAGYGSRIPATPGSSAAIDLKRILKSHFFETWPSKNCGSLGDKIPVNLVVNLQKIAGEWLVPAISRARTIRLP